MVADNGIQCIEEYPSLRTNIRLQVADLDVSASYPNAGACFNTSKRTTWRELCHIDGVTEEKRRTAGINLSGGETNAIENAVDLFNVPELNTWEKQFLADIESDAVT